MSGTNNGNAPRSPIGERLAALRNERELTLREVCERVRKLGVHCTEGGISALENGKYKKAGPRPALLDALCEVLKANVAVFPEWWIARAHLALGDGENKLVRYDRDLPVDELEKLTRARRLSEPHGPSTVAEAADLLPPPPHTRRSQGRAAERRAARGPRKTA